MKIQKKDLDLDIVASLDVIDSLKKNFTSDSGFLAFNGKEMYVKEFKDPNSRRLVDFAYINGFKDYRYETDNLFINTFQNIMADTSLDTFRSSLVSPKLETIFKAKSTIIFTKKLDNFLYVITEDGTFYKYDVDNGRAIFELDFTRLGREFFDIEMLGTAVSDICHDEEDLYISTYKYGVFLLNEDTRSMKRIIMEPNVTHLEILGNSLLVFSDMLYIYSLETFARTEKINFYKNEKIMKVLDAGERIFVVGKSMGAFATEKALHLLELDELGSVVLSDCKVAKNPSFNSYDIQWANTDGEHVYVSGIKGRHAFLWEYLVNDPVQFREIIIDRFHSEQVLSVEKYFENFVLYTKEHIVVVKNGEIRRNLNVPDVVREVIYVGGHYFFRSADAIVRVLPVDYSTGNKTTLKIDSLRDTNELEVCLFGDAKMTFVTDQGSRIAPMFTIKHKDLIFSRLAIPADVSVVSVVIDNIVTNIDSVVVKKNRIFYK